MNKEEVKILIADDEEIIRKGLKKLLNNKGYTNIIETDDGKKVLSLINEIPIDIYILDIKMPGVDGIKLLKEIKKIQNKSKVIIITGHGNIENCREAFLFGASDFLTKPFDIEQLYNCLERVIQELSLQPETLEKIGDKNLSDEILKLINIIYDKNTDNTLRENAVLKLGKLKDKRVIPLLLNLLNTADKNLKEKIIFVLGRIGDPIIYEELLQILKNEKEDNEIRLAAIMALNFLGKKEITKPFIEKIQTKIKQKALKKTEKELIKKELKLSPNIKIEITKDLFVIYFYNDLTLDDLKNLNDFIENENTKKIIENIFNINLNFFYALNAPVELLDFIKNLNKNFPHMIVYLSKKYSPVNEAIIKLENELNINYL